MKSQHKYMLRTIWMTFFIQIASLLAFSQDTQDEPVPKKIHAPSVFGISFGVSGLDMDCWTEFMENYQHELENVNSVRCNEIAFQLDFFLKIRVHRQWTVGFDFQSLYNNMSIEYSDYTGLNFMQMIFAEGEKKISLKTRSIILLPGVNWYIPDNLPGFRPFLEAGLGYGSTKIQFDEHVIDGHGNGLAAVTAIGFEAGNTALFHLRAGYRYYDPNMKYSASHNAPDNPGVNQSGFFISAGIGLRLN